MENLLNETLKFLIRNSLLILKVLKSAYCSPGSTLAGIVAKHVISKRPLMSACNSDTSILN